MHRSSLSVLLVAALFVETVPALQDALPLATPAAPPLSGAELALWNDPAFQRRFAESYVAETEIEPRVTESERKQMLKVLELISSDAMDQAARLLEEQRGPASSAVFDFTLANIHFQADRLDEAAAAYAIAVEKYPKFRRAWRNLGLIRVRGNEHAQAVAALTRVLELGGGDAVTWGLLGFSHAGLENHLAAESAYRMAALLDPQTLEWKLHLARSLFRQERFADAVALCAGLIAEHPGRADFWLLQANAYIGLGRPLDAVANFEVVDRLGAATAATLQMQGDIYVNEELFEPAVEAWVRALDLDPAASPERAMRAAQVLTARGALAETRRLVEHIEATRGEGLSADARKALLKLHARLAVAEGAGEEEAAVLERIVELDPLDGEALLLLGQHAARGQDAERAEFWYQRAEGLPEFEADAKVRLAQLHVAAGRYAEALPLLRRAQVLKPRENIAAYLEQVERVAASR